METLTRRTSVREKTRAWRAAGKTVALVPTAGGLHKGHLGLVAAAQERADRVIVSISATLPDEEAPRLEADRELLQKIEADVVFTPPFQEMHLSGRDLEVQVVCPRVSGELEGPLRPGGTGAMLTVMLKLVHIVGPDVLILGEHDFHQVVSVKHMLHDLFVAVEVVSVPAFRESDGLVLARVNRELSREHRAIAPQLYSTLKKLAKRIDAGERGFEMLEREAGAMLVAAGFERGQVAIRQAADLATVRGGTRDLVILAAGSLAGLRLIDHLRVRLIDRF